MKRFSRISFCLSTTLLLLLTCCSHPPKYLPTDYLPKTAQDSTMNQIVRYAAKLPPRATIATRLESRFDEYYKRVAADYRFLYVTPVADQKRSFYFLIARPARSLQPMSEGIGGKLVLKGTDSLAFYDEIFRTWKMPMDTLRKRGLMLFEHMIDGRDLSLFYPKYSGDHYIEFPDGRFSFDTTRRVWLDQMMDTLDIQQLP